MKKAVLLITSALGVIATVATVVMMFGIAIDVAYRTFYNKSVPGVLEVSEAALVAAVFLGMSYTGATNSHISVDLLTERLPHKVSRWVVTVAWTLVVVIVGWMLYATTLRAIKATEENEVRMGLVNWPLWPSRWIIVIGLAAMMMVAVINVVRTASGREVLGLDQQMPDVTVHPYEYVTGSSDAASETDLGATEGDKS